MISQWWLQIRAVIRLEMKKTFFARRGLWVYLLVLAPALLFLAHSINELQNRDRRHALASAHPVARETLMSIKRGMTRDQVVALAGQPYGQTKFGRRFREAAVYY